jgi:hypothetical protein
MERASFAVFEGRALQVEDRERDSQLPDDIDRPIIYDLWGGVSLTT